MTENQTRIFTLPECAPTESAPVFLSGGELLRDEAAESVKACLMLKNLSGKELSRRAEQFRKICNVK